MDIVSGSLLIFTIFMLGFLINFCNLCSVMIWNKTPVDASPTHKVTITITSQLSLNMIDKIFYDGYF